MNTSVVLVRIHHRKGSHHHPAPPLLIFRCSNRKQDGSNAFSSDGAFVCLCCELATSFNRCSVQHRGDSRGMRNLRVKQLCANFKLRFHFAKYHAGVDSIVLPFMFRDGTTTGPQWDHLEIRLATLAKGDSVGLPGRDSHFTSSCGGLGGQHRCG